MVAGSALSLLVLIHPNAWKENSANFAVTEFSEVELPLSIALCSDIGPPLVPSSGGSVSRFSKPPALCLIASVVGVGQLH
jgi:hypothetical protein